jgi:hypothetical protein
MLYYKMGNNNNNINLEQPKKLPEPLPPFVLDE